jgi:hypothetical protein
MFYTSTWEVLGSYVDQATGCSEMSRGIPQSLQPNAEIVTRVNHDHFLRNIFFQIYYSPIIPIRHHKSLWEKQRLNPQEWVSELSINL